MKNYNSLLVFLVIFFGWTAEVYAQTLNCTQQLRRAEDAYEDGLLSEVNSLLEPCMDNFSKQERITAYRLLTLTNIFDDEMEQAEENFVKLLREDPEHEVSFELDPAELVYLHKKYRTRPIYNLSFKGGLNMSFPLIMNRYGPYNIHTTEENIESRLEGAQFAMELDVPINDYLWVFGGATLASRSFQSSTTFLERERLDYTESHTWLDIPFGLKFQFPMVGQVSPYVYAGGAMSYLFDARISAVRSGGQEVTGSSINLLSDNMRRRLVYNHLLGAGFRYKFGIYYLLVEARYAISHHVMVPGENRYNNQELLFRYGHQSHDYRLDNLGFFIGVQKSFFNPKKLKKARK